MRSGRWEGSEPAGKRVKKYVREPNDSTLSWTNLLSPPMIDAIEITEETPMTMPSTVKADRTFDERNVCMAARKFSLACATVIMAISRTSTPRQDRAGKRGAPDKFQRTIRRRS